MGGYPEGCCKSCFLLDEEPRRIRRCVLMAGHDGLHTKGVVDWSDTGVPDYADYTGVLVPFEAWEAAVLSEKPCDDCGVLSNDLITKGDHHGGQKTVCRDRDACHRRSPG